MKGGYLTSTVTISTILGDVTTFVTSAISWVQSIASAITSNPIIEVFVITAFVGLGVGLIRRMIRL